MKKTPITITAIAGIIAIIWLLNSRQTPEQKQVHHRAIVLDSDRVDFERMSDSVFHDSMLSVVELDSSMIDTISILIP